LGLVEEESNASKLKSLGVLGRKRAMTTSAARPRLRRQGHASAPTPNAGIVVK
jgi:hypothetical protein